jgi:O-antigen ligase
MIKLLILMVAAMGAVGGVILLLRYPKILLAGYLIAVPVLPSLPIGEIEITVMDYLTIPALVLILYNFARSSFRIAGPIAAGFSFYVAAAALSNVSFICIHSDFSLGIFLRLVRLVEMLLPVILASQMAASLKLKNISRQFLLGCGLAALAGVVMFAFGIILREKQAFFAEGIMIFRAAGTVGEANCFGNLMAITGILAVWVIIYYRESFKTGSSRLIMVFSIIWGVLGVVGVVISLSRSAMGLMVIGLVCLFLPLIKRPGRLLKIIIGAALVIVVVAIIFWFQFANEFIVKAFLEVPEKLSLLTQIGSNFSTATSSRMENWRMEWAIFAGHPLAWPLGLGYKSLRLYYDLPPDNNFLQALFEMGVVGLLALLAMIALFFKAAWKKFREDYRIGILPLALWSGFAISMVAVDYITCWHTVPPLLALLAVAVRSEQSSG